MPARTHILPHSKRNSGSNAGAGNTSDYEVSWMSIDDAAVLLVNLARRSETTDCEREALSLGVKALKYTKEKKVVGLI